jgi:hypothetical protein
MDAPSPEKIAEADAKARREVGVVVSLVSAASGWAAGAAGLAVCHLWGPLLGEVGQMYFFLETEPVERGVPTPWALALVTALLPVPILLAKRWRLLVFSTVPFALLPWWQIWRLTLAAAPG